MLVTRKLLRSGSSGCVMVLNYSKKSDHNTGPYKVVTSTELSNDVLDSRLSIYPNWEIFAPRGYRFLMPGSVGPAWHEPASMVPINLFHKNSSNYNDTDTFECTCQDCPILLRKGVTELFPGSELSTSQPVTIITLVHKKSSNSTKSRSKKTDNDSIESNAKNFVWAAQEICMKLKMAGYWADFINPFSGKPYLNPFFKSGLYETDERFRCFGFTVEKNGNCKTIQEYLGNDFIGSLYTNAPANTILIRDIINEN